MACECDCLIGDFGDEVFERVGYGLGGDALVHECFVLLIAVFMVMFVNTIVIELFELCVCVEVVIGIDELDCCVT